MIENNLYGVILGGALTIIGGLCASGLNYFLNNQSMKNQHVKEQLRNLYSPLYSLISVYKAIDEQYNQINNAYTTCYINQQWSEEEQTQKNLDKDTKQTIDVLNQLARKETQLLKKCKQLLETNFSYSDEDDIELFSDMIVSIYSITNQLELPFNIKNEIEQNLEPKKFLIGIFIETLQKKITAKMKI